MDEPSHKPSIVERLAGLAAFIPIFEAESFTFGTWDAGAGHLPWFSAGTDAIRFIRATYHLGWVVPGFNWNDWSQSTEARKLLNEQGAVAGASIEDIEHLLTAHIRVDRFIEGHLDSIFASGYLLAVLRRSAKLLHQTGAAGQDDDAATERA